MRLWVRLPDGWGWLLVTARILKFITRDDGVFDPETTRLMGEAFEAAWKALHDTGQPELVYEIIARRIINAARAGERDPAKLRDAGLAALPMR
jgi:hypothetical protein